MIRFYLLPIFLIILNLSFAQNNSSILGHVYDSESKPLEKATVSVVSEKDSIVITYALTNEKGEFDLVKIPANKELLFFVSHVNSSPFQRKINLKPGEKYKMDSIILKGNTIEEISITAVPPIRLNGDTLEYKADYFKTRPNATVEELIRILPGLQVNADGSIYYQGREVSGVRVNNKDFFAQDLKIATRNLDASLIDIVQVIKDKGESKREILDDSELPIVINLKMKKEFLKANFGKFYGGAATRDRYESGALINTFRDTLQVSFIGFANNINRQGFDYSELNEHGGMNRMENNSYTYWSSNGLMNQVSAGVNVNYDIAKKLKTNLMYNYGQHDFYSDNSRTGNSFYNEILEQSKGNSINENSNLNHELKAFVRYNIDTTSQFTFSTNLTQSKHTADYMGNSESWRNEADYVLRSESNSSNNNKRFNYYHSFYIEKKFKNKWLLSFNHNLRNNNGSGIRDNNSNSRYFLFNDSTILQHQIENSNNQSQNLEHNINLQVPIHKKINFDLYAQQINGNQWETQDILNKINADEFSNRNDVANNKGLRNKVFYAGTKWNISLIKDLPISIGIKYASQSNNFDYYQKRENLKNENSYWLPDFSITYRNLNLNYNKSFSAPNFYSIVSVNSDLYPTRIQLASPFFDNTIEERYAIRYNKFFNKSKINFFISANYSTKDNSIGYANTYNTENSTGTNQSYQAGPTDSYGTNISFSKTFLQNKNWNLSFSTYSYVYANQNYSMSNNEENLATQFYGNWNNTVTFSYKSAFTFTPTFAMGINKTNFKYDSENFKNINNTNTSLGATLLLNNIKKFRIESSFTVKNQVVGINGDRRNLNILNASIYYPILGKGELKFSAFDILNQNVSNNFSSYGNSTNYSQTLTLRQYFMLGMVYKFLKTGK